MKISDISNEIIMNYLKIDDSYDETDTEISFMKESAINYIKTYTGLEDDELDEHEDLTQALLLLVSEFFNNRDYYLENKQSVINKAVKNILCMHSVNLL